MQTHTKLTKGVSWFLVFFIALSFSLQAQRKKAIEVESDRLKAKSLAFFDNEDWEGLENLLTTSLENGQEDLTAYQVPKFRVYHIGLSVRSKAVKGGDNDALQKKYYAKLEKWKQAYPDSIFTKPVEIDYWTWYAWDARGNGYANSVTEEGWEGFNERLNKANEIFQECIKGGVVYPNPTLYMEANSIALGQGWELEYAYETICKPVIRHYPFAVNVFRIGHRRYLPKWGGETWGELRYYNRVAKDLPNTNAEIFYAKAILYRFDDGAQLYHEKLFDEELFMRGVMKLITKSPKESFFLELTLKFLSTYKVNAHYKLYSDLQKEHPDLIDGLIEHRPRETHVLKAMRIPLEDGLNSIQRYKWIRNVRLSGIRENVCIRYMHYLKRLDGIICSADYSGLIIANTVTGESIETQKWSGHFATRVAISSDDKYVAAIWGEKNDGELNFIFKLYDISTGKFKEVASRPCREGWNFRSMIFSEDNETLYFSTIQISKRKSEFWAWKWKTKEPATLLHQSKNSNWACEIEYNKNSGEFIYLDGNLLSYNSDALGDKTVAFVPGPEKASYFIDGQLFGEGKYYAALTYSSGKKAHKFQSSLYIYDVATKQLLTKLLLPVGSKNLRQFNFKLQPTEEENVWKITSIGEPSSVATWVLRKEESFTLANTSYNAWNGFSFADIAVKDGSDQESPIFIGNSKGFLCTWQYPEYIKEPTSRQKGSSQKGKRSY